MREDDMNRTTDTNRMNEMMNEAIGSRGILTAALKSIALYPAERAWLWP